MSAPVQVLVLAPVQRHRDGPNADYYRPRAATVVE